jgi:hypothetical protein
MSKGVYPPPPFDVILVKIYEKKEAKKGELGKEKGRKRKYQRKPDGESICKINAKRAKIEDKKGI